MTHACNPSTLKNDAGGLLKSFGLHSTKSFLLSTTRLSWWLLYRVLSFPTASSQIMTWGLNYKSMLLA